MQGLFASKSLPVRNIKLHEYQASKLLKDYNVPIPQVRIESNTHEG
jgi:hypothetical protein